MNAVASRSLHVARGRQRHANFPLRLGTSVVGSSRTMCQFVLPDEGIAPRHFALGVDRSGRVTCTALDAAVRVGRRELPRGASMAMPDFLPLVCGEATLIVGPEGSDWSFSTVAAELAPGLAQRVFAGLQKLRAAQPTAFIALWLAASLLLAGSVWAAASWLSMPLSMDDPARVQRWLLSVSPPGSELELIGDETRGALVVAGYVATDQDLEVLAGALARRPERWHAEVYSQQSLRASLARAAQRAGVPCEVVWRGAGRVACRGRIADAAGAQRLREAASQLAGLRELALDAAELVPVVAAVSAEAPRRMPRRYAVLMSDRRGSQLVGPAGERWSEGDAFNGMTILRIAFDHVVFAHESGELVLPLAQLQ
jgi:hypothetical protein